MVEKRSSDPDSTSSIPVFLKSISDSFNPHVHNWDLIDNTKLNWGSRKYGQPQTGLARALVGSWIGDYMGTPGAADKGSDNDAARRRVDSVKSGVCWLS